MGSTLAFYGYQNGLAQIDCIASLSCEHPEGLNFFATFSECCFQFAEVSRELP